MTRASWLAARVLTAAALAVDSYIHFDLAGVYAGIADGISQAMLFRIEASAAALAAVLVVLVRSPLSDAFALVVAGSGLGAIVLYRYVDVGSIGPIPNMYEPVWYQEKTIVAVAMAVAIVLAAGLLLTQARRTASASGPDARRFR